MWNISERLPAAEFPVAVLADEPVLIVAALRDRWLFVRSRRDILPARPRCRRVALNVDNEVCEDVIRPGRLARRTDVLLHECFDRGWTFDGSKAADPLPVFSEELPE